LKDNKSISLLNLSSGEVYDTGLKHSDNRFMQRGDKMYAHGIEKLVDVLSKGEFKIVLNMFDSSTVDYYNRLMVPFKNVTPGMATSNRSKLKKKLIENGFMLEYKGKLMLNPYVFIPRGDKNIRNCNWLTQRAWKYLVEDCNTTSEEIEEHAEMLFGKPDKSDWLKIKDRFCKA